MAFLGQARLWEKQREAEPSLLILKEGLQQVSIFDIRIRVGFGKILPALI